MQHSEDLSVVAGDDLTLTVAFRANDSPYILADGDAVELIVHLPGGGDRIILPCQVQDNQAVFYLSGEDTAGLHDVNPYGVFPVCIKINFAGGGSDTPIYRRPLWIARC